MRKIRSFSYWPILGTTILLFFATIACSGIPILDSNGNTHYVIVGIGVVSVHKNPNESISVARTTALGAVISNQSGLKLSAGFSTGSTVSIADATEDVMIEIASQPAGAIRISATHVVTDE